MVKSRTVYFRNQILNQKVAERTHRLRLSAEADNAQIFCINKVHTYTGKLQGPIFKVMAHLNDHLDKMLQITYCDSLVFIRIIKMYKE